MVFNKPPPFDGRGLGEGGEIREDGPSCKVSPPPPQPSPIQGEGVEVQAYGS
jgi:hypothetical protein